MTAPLRRAHLWVWLLLAVAMPLLLALAVAVRRAATPVNPALNWEKYR